MPWQAVLPAESAGIEQMQVLHERVTAEQFQRLFVTMDPSRQVDLLFAIASGGARA